MSRPANTLSLVAAVCALTISATSPSAAELKPGDMLGPDNAHLAEGMIPPEVLEYYRKGEWKNEIAAYPEGKHKYEKEFLAATADNAKHLDVSAIGGIIDKRTGKLPAYKIMGFPFPDIDPKDPKAGVKILWNYNYMYFNIGTSKNFLDVIWVNRDGMERYAAQEVYFLFYEGQKDRYVPKTNPDNMLSQFLATTVGPQDLYGTTALGWRFREHDKRDLAWAFVPALRRIRALSPANRSDGFLGSDMAQDDGPFFDGKPEDFDWKLVGEKEMYRLYDPYSLAGTAPIKKLEDGGWRGFFSTDPIAGFEDPNWKGNPWAPVQHHLVKRPLWIVEGTPKDKYYLYGKVQLYIDKEQFQGAWSRKFDWKGELLSDYVATGYLNAIRHADDGAEEWFWGAFLAYQCAINVKQDRATVAGFPIKDRGKAVNDRRIMLEPEFFDYQSLYRFGK